MAAAVLEVAHAALADAGPVLAVGITAQRASTVVWDRATGEPVGTGLGWQDLRTVIDCIIAKAEHGLALAPNQSATKVAWLLNTFDPGREPRPVLRHRRLVGRLGADERRGARHRSLERGRHRSAAPRCVRLVRRPRAPP